VAKYIGDLAAAGKKEYALPMYVNASLRDPFNPGKAGDYASGGPTDNVISIYRAAAPAIDIVAPDIYMKESKKAYRAIELYKSGGPLLVPEIGNDPLFARYFYDVLGAQAVGIVPFASISPATQIPAGRAQHRRGHRGVCAAVPVAGPDGA
jgi:beta-galactosidase GanA